MGDIMDYPKKYLKKLEQVVNDVEIKDENNKSRLPLLQILAQYSLNLPRILDIP